MAAVSKVTILKFLQLVLTVTCLGMHFKDNGPAYYLDNLVVTGTFAGFFIILVGTFAGAVLGDNLTKRVDIFYSLAGCALFVASGALCIKYYDAFGSGDTRHLGLAKGSLAIINGVFFLLDGFFTYRGE
ncbi:uncharacterized protein LOC134537623 [Bacillus rossius redtenbacheri]|uniref:uncharacterized protein LOC134537623 n=1 Tax=Bacillus rossius redtenbacheri TaxID=93214 RepID=UPI002FDE9119